MGLNTFNNKGINVSNVPLYRLLPLSTPNRIYGQGLATGDYNSLPVVRSGAFDKSFRPAQNSLELLTTSSLGDSTQTALIIYSTYITTGSVGVGAAYLSTSDSCLYLLLVSSTPQWRVIKVADTTGVVTTIGATFTPTTISNWPSYASGTCTMEIDTSSGHLKVTCAGATHLINKTTGALVTQDTPVVLGAHNTKRVHYVTQDGVVGVGSSTFGGAANSITLPNTVHTTYGNLPSYSLATGAYPSIFTEQPIISPLVMVLIDTDKVGIIKFSAAPIGNFCMYTRQDIDKYFKSISEIRAGVL